MAVRGKMFYAALLLAGLFALAKADLLGGEGYKALEFSGSTWVEIPVGASMLAGKEFSFEAWIKVPVGDMSSSANPIVRPIISRYRTDIANPTNNQNDFELAVNPAGQIIFFAGGSSGDEPAFLMKSNVTLANHKWYHVGLSIQYTDIDAPFPYRANLYVDDWSSGSLVRETTVSYWIGPGYTRSVLINEPFAIGKYVNNDPDYPNGQFFVGLIDEVRIWQGKRQASDFANFAFRTVAHPKDDLWAVTVEDGGSSSTLLVVSYNFNAGSVTAVYDQSLNQFDAVIRSTTLPTYQPNDVPIVSYIYAVGSIPLAVNLFGIDTANVDLMGLNFIVHTDATLRGNFFVYDPLNRGAANNQYPVDIQPETPGIGDAINNGDQVAANKIVYVHTPGQATLARFFYTVTDGVRTSAPVEVRIVISCANTGDVVDNCGICNGGNAAFDQCDVCFGNSTTCVGCDGVPNSGLVLDRCDVCGGDNECVGCDDVPHSGKVVDPCGVCGGHNNTCYGCDGNGGVPDECGVCNGNNTSCLGCDGIPHGAQYDLCDVCGGNNTCLGCDGVPFSGVWPDACGVCGGNGSSCAGCDGIPHSGLEWDNCHVCGGNGSTCAGCDGSGGGVLDACGVCRGDNSTCGGCDGKGGVVDACDVCAGDNSTCTCVTYHGYHVQELDYVLLQWGLTHSIKDIDHAIKELDESLHLLHHYSGDLDLASVVIYLEEFVNITLSYEKTVDAFKRELDISLGNIYIGPEGY